MLRKISLIILFIITNSCGYEAMHSKKNKMIYNFTIVEIIFDGDRDINIKIKEQLSNYLGLKAEKAFELVVKSVSERTITAKDVQANPISYKNTTAVYVDILFKDKVKSSLKIERSFKYDNKTNKFDLATYERDLKINMAEEITKELILKLSNIQ